VWVTADKNYKSKLQFWDDGAVALVQGGKAQFAAIAWGRCCRGAL